MKKESKSLKIGNIYNLELNELYPIEVEVLDILEEKQVVVRYFNNPIEKIEILPIELF